MKKFLIAVMLVFGMASADAGSYYNNYNGLWYGNVCRTGLYFSIVAYAPIGQGCWNYGWNMMGVITDQ